MGLSTHVEAVRPPDEKWKAMKRAYEACETAGVEIPKEVQEFFGYEEPDSNGVVVPIENTMAVGTFEENGRSGFSVEIDKLPPDVKIVRFWISY